MQKTQSKKINKKVMLLTAMSVLLTAILVLSGVGIYFKLTRKENPTVEVNPLDFSYDTWDGTIEAVNFNENYAGRGTQTKTINSAASFVHFISEVNSGNSFENYTVYLNSNIDLNVRSIASIGSAETPFKGTFDGGHYTILNAKINGNGLFENTENATIKNVGLYNANASLIHKAINTNVENCFVRLGNGKLINEYISNNGNHYVKNSFVDSNASGLIGSVDTNGTSENTISITNSYFTKGSSAIAERIGVAYVYENKTIKATNRSDFADWSYSPEYKTDKDWCNYDYLANSQKLDFVYPIQAGFVKVYLTGSCYESVVKSKNGGSVVDATNLAEAFTEADKEETAEVNLLVEKIFMEARAEAESANVTINAVKDTTIVRGENNTDAMFVGKGTSKITLGTAPSVGTASGTSNANATLTLDGNREYVEKNNLDSGALVVANGGEVEIHDNVVIKNNINNTTGYGGAVIVANAQEEMSVKATFENCSSTNGGGAMVVVSQQENVELKLGSFINCSSGEAGGGALYLSSSLPKATTQAINKLYGGKTLIQPLTTTSTKWEITGSGEAGSGYDNTTFQGCDSGAINCTGHLIISGSPTFINNRSDFGGAVCSITLSITGNPLFESNSVYDGGIGGCGGAIHATRVTIDGNPTFRNNGDYNNSCTASGGAICVGEPYYSNNFDENSVENVYTITISGSPIFENNGKWTYGEESSTGVSSDGGAIYCKGRIYENGSYTNVGEVVITGSPTFSGNQSSSKGGAIYATGTTTIGAGSTASFTGNQSTAEGGAIFCDGNVNIAEGAEVTFKGNSGSHGGAICLLGEMTISGKATFGGNAEGEGNQATHGGAINGTVKINSTADTSFIGNHASQGGAILSTIVNIKGKAVFTSNHADSRGGAIFAYSENDTASVTIDSGAETIFTSNYSGSEGGAISARGTVTISGAAKFDLNGIHFEESETYECVTSLGGAIYATGNVEINAAAEFNGNVSTDKGGAIYSNGKVTISQNATFNNNGDMPTYDSETGEFTYPYSWSGTTSSGGAIYASGVDITGAPSFTANKNGCSGSGIHVGGAAINTAGNVTISGAATFESNGGMALYGGAINADGDISISGDAKFNSNLSYAGGGGAIYCSGEVTIDAVAEFKNNNADYISQYGGAIYADSVRILDNAIFEGNYVSCSEYGSAYGGAIYATTVDISASPSFVSNRTWLSGGGGEDGFVSGGAIHSGTVTITGTPTFSGNYTDKYDGCNSVDIGSAIYATTSLSISSNISITSDSKADVNAGEIAVGATFDLGADLTISSTNSVSSFVLTNSSAYIRVTSPLSNTYSVSKTGLTVYDPNNEQASSYIFEDNTGSLTSNPFTLISPAEIELDFDNVKSNFCVVTGINKVDPVLKIKGSTNLGDQSMIANATNYWYIEANCNGTMNITSSNASVITVGYNDSDSYSTSVTANYEYNSVRVKSAESGESTLTFTFTPTDTGSYNTITKTVKVTIGKAQVTLSLYEDEYGDIYKYHTIGIGDFAASYYSVSADGSSVSGTITVTVVDPTIIRYEDYGGELNFWGAKAGSTEVILNFTPDNTENYTTATNTIYITVTAYPSNLSVTPTEMTIYVGRNSTFDYAVDCSPPGNVSISVDNGDYVEIVNYNVEINDAGSKGGTATIKGLAVGETDIYITFTPVDESYQTETVTLHVVVEEPQISAEITIIEEQSFVVEGDDDGDNGYAHYYPTGIRVDSADVNSVYVKITSPKFEFGGSGYRVAQISTNQVCSLGINCEYEVSHGKATIPVTLEVYASVDSNGNPTGSCLASITYNVEAVWPDFEISFNPTEIEVEIDETISINAISNIAANYIVSSSNTDVVTTDNVGDNGYHGKFNLYYNETTISCLNAVGAGQSIITISVYDPTEGSTSNLLGTGTFVVTVNPKTLSAPTNAEWDTETSNTTASWNAVENATGYYVQLYKNGEPVGEVVEVTTNTYDFASMIKTYGAGRYSFSVSAAGGENYAESEFSQISSETGVATVTIIVSNSGYGSVNGLEKLEFSQPLNSTITADNSKITIGEVEVIAKAENASAEFTYSFVGWSGLIPELTRDVMIMANFTKTSNNYTVKFSVDESSAGFGSVSINEVRVPYGTFVMFEENTIYVGANKIVATPEEENDSMKYEFVGWKGMIEVVEGAAEIKAEFSATQKTYKITFAVNDSSLGSVNMNDSTISELTLAYGKQIKTDGNRLLINDDEFVITAVARYAPTGYSYNFVGWQGVAEGGQQLTSNITITALFEKVAATTNVTISVNNNAHGILKFGTETNTTFTITVPLGAQVYCVDNILTIGDQHLSAIPTEGNANYTYSFANWEFTGSTVTENMTITAKFSEDVKTYTVTLIAENGSLSDGTSTGETLNIEAAYGAKIHVNGNVITIIDGETTTNITLTASEGYAFEKWIGVVGTVQGAVRITARCVA